MITLVSRLRLIDFANVSHPNLGDGAKLHEVDYNADDTWWRCWNWGFFQERSSCFIFMQFAFMWWVLKNIWRESNKTIKFQGPDSGLLLGLDNFLSILKQIVLRLGKHSLQWFSPIAQEHNRDVDPRQRLCMIPHKPANRKLVSGRRPPGKTRTLTTGIFTTFTSIPPFGSNTRHDQVMFVISRNKLLYFNIQVLRSITGMFWLLNSPDDADQTVHHWSIFLGAVYYNQMRGE